jgi:hypothetical protein
MAHREWEAAARRWLSRWDVFVEPVGSLAAMRKSLMSIDYSVTPLGDGAH